MDIREVRKEMTVESPIGPTASECGSTSSKGRVGFNITTALVRFTSTREKLGAGKYQAKYHATLDLFMKNA